jgi:glutamyl-tRNA synthetase
MNTELQNKIIALLTGDQKILARSEVEAHYPKRSLSEGAEVTRFCPSPTGFMHIGAVFTAMFCQRVAAQSGGVYMLRIEDTDKSREVAGAKELIVSQLQAFELTPDEGLQVDGSTIGDYGPYVQSERKNIYLAYAIDLIQRGRAYPCFATNDELNAAVSDQKAKKQRPGYYGEWALWRDRSDADIEAALNSGKSFVLRFKSSGSHDKRITISDRIKGKIELPQNDSDVPLIKSDGSGLPTYHLAHVVDDYLMGATIIMRGEEWLPSTPLHADLAIALDIKPFKYAHTPVISIVGDEGGKRKLSKRKDPEADMAFWQQAAYPLKAIKAYLLGLANSNFEDWYRENPDAPLVDFPFSLEKLRSSRSPLLDMKKVEDYSKDEIARMPQDHFNKEVLQWTELHDHDLYKAMVLDPEYTNAVLSIERSGEKPRKDVAKWSDVSEQFGYYYDYIFENQNKEQLEISAEDIVNACENFMAGYDHSADKDAWFDNMKTAAEKSGYALDRKDMKENPDKYKGGLADFAKIIRVKTTGKTRTPDLHTIMQVMGQERVVARLG